MIRLIVNTTDQCPAVYAGGEVVRTAKTFDVDLPDLESALAKNDSQYVTVSLTYELR